MLGLRVSRRWGPARIAYHLHLNISTVHRILARYLCPPLRFTDPATGIRLRGRDRARRYEYAWPGEMIHVDIKKLGRIPDGGGHRVHGRLQGKANTLAEDRRIDRGQVSEATPSSTTQLMTTPGSSIRKSCPTKPRKPRRRSCATPSTPSPYSASKSSAS